jgi:hypothetical protein
VDGAAELAAHPPDRVPPRQLVAAERPEDEQRLGVHRPGQGGQQLQGCVVGPLEIIQEQRRRVPGGDRRQRQADGLEQGRAVALGRGRAELREQQRQVGGQRPLDQPAAPLRAQLRPQHLHDGTERGGPSLDPEALEHLQAGAGQQPSCQGGLAHAGLAGQQDQRPTTGERLCHARL